MTPCLCEALLKPVPFGCGKMLCVNHPLALKKMMIILQPVDLR